MSGRGLWVEFKDAVGSTLVQWGVTLLSADARTHLFALITKATTNDDDAGVSR